MNDRLNKYFSKYAEEYAFLELMPDYVRKEHIDFMRGVPLPVKHKYVMDLAGQQGIDFKYFTMGMINMLGIDPEFKYASKYAMFLTYMNPQIRQVIVNVGIGLAQTEHLRWNASHQALGYQYDSSGKDEARLLHDCLCDWEQLKDDKRSYDYNTVDVSLIEYGFNDELSTH